MKTRSLIVRTLLLIVLLSPLGLRAFGSRVSASSSELNGQRLQAAHGEELTVGAMHRPVLSFPGRRSPAQRLHKIRGKRINVDTALIPTPEPCAVARLPFSNVLLTQKELDCPNPPRGPPTLFSL
jgi:hypothetical protein